MIAQLQRYIFVRFIINYLRMELMKLRIYTTAKHFYGLVSDFYLKLRYLPTITVSVFLLHSVQHSIIT